MSVEVGVPPVLVPPPPVVVVGGVSDVVGGGVVVVVGGFGVVVTGGFGVVVCGGGLPPVSLRGGGGGWVTSVVVVLPSGLTDTTVVGALEDVVADSVVGAPTVDGPAEDGVAGTVCRPACEVPWPPVPPVPPAVVAGPGPASSATAANAVATTRPATPSTTYPVRFGLLLLGGAVSILVIPSGRGIQAPWGNFGEARARSVTGHCARGGGATSARRLSPACGYSPR
ncbi:hypothetical protein EIY87_05510 [Amycolatopsis eburnea]|uniref:Uncharacterized protein n=1 Tax=Amycolatopsis eburnea TaxID=2267691 RepID=A0A3R9E5P5_9PSEU|nr:hypothetical protein EIY87_05510 [Amycolatopsis eburnea]